MQVKHRNLDETPCHSSAAPEMVASLASPVEKNTECAVRVIEESCPICQEKLGIQKMVFQCGHVTCCKCNPPVPIFFVKRKQENEGFP